MDWWWWASIPFQPAGSGLRVARTKSRPVVLDPADRAMLTALVRTGSHPASQVRRARILLELDENDPGRVGRGERVPTQEVVAERVGVPVVADFRARDVAAGGQGAPLVSVLDQLLLAGSGQPAGLLNLGGIANLTAVRPGRATVAFDCGPANALLDVALAGATGDRYDAGGARAARGTVDPALLDVLLADPYLAGAPPKTTGKERYNRKFLDSALEQAPVRDLDDVLATLAEAAAAAVAADVRRLGLTRVWASGGGVHNAGLMAALQRRLEAVGASLATTATLGLPIDHKEAYAFALLGWLTWHGLPGSLASCTGASGPRILGTIVPGREPLRLPEPKPTTPNRIVLEPRS